MPTYDYVCDACEYEFELFHSMTEKPVRKCPKCGRLKVRRMISGGAGVLFKGSGFYQTDYRSKSYQEGHKKAHQQKSGSKQKTQCPASTSACKSCPQAGSAGN